MLRKAAWLIPVACLLIALLDMPYGYYQLLRVLIFCSSIYITISEKERDGEVWLWAFIFCALVYNPIIKLSLGREIWAIVNVATAILFLAYGWVRRTVNLSRGDGH